MDIAIIHDDFREGLLSPIRNLQKLQIEPGQISTDHTKINIKRNCCVVSKFVD